MHTQQDRSALPHWDMSTPYPSLSSPEFETALEEAGAALEALTDSFDTAKVGLRETSLPVTESLAPLEHALEALNALGTELHTLYAYTIGYATTDSRNTLAQAQLDRVQRLRVAYEQLITRFTAWAGALDIEGLIARSPHAEAHAFFLRKIAVEAEHLMSPEEERLASQLSLTGRIAWNKLYSNFTSQIMVEVPLKPEPRRLPMTAVRNLAFDPDRDVRRVAYETELAAWETHALPITAALNSIKGETRLLMERRGWASPLDYALFNNHIDRETLEALTATTRAFFPELRRYLRLKARALGVERLAWYDLFAPVGQEQEVWSFERARAFIVEQFGTYSDELAELARRAFADRWIDAEPRDGKRGGAFCIFLQGAESRILANYQPAYGGMGTLAHELGHAFHNVQRAPRTFLQRQTPMTLAETASTFCETLVQEAALLRAAPLAQLAILEAALQDITQISVDILSRLRFEEALFERRGKGELATEELCELMLEAQRATYGDALDPERLHPYMWAVKPHYYASTFYNFPYLFGQLFSLGLYAVYREDPEGFRPRYEGLLSETGMADAATLASRFGFDVRREAFWQASLEVVREEVDRFEALIETPGGIS